MQARNSHSEKGCDGDNRREEQSSLESGVVRMSKNSNIQCVGNVNLLIDGKVFGNATLRIPQKMSQEKRALIEGNERDLRRPFEGCLYCELGRLERKGETFTVVEKVNISSECADMDMPYCTPGIEEGTEPLGELNTTSCYF